MRVMFRLPALLGIMVMIIVGCADGDPQGTGRTTSDHDQLRIVSFSPAMTRIAADLGFAEFIVGRTPWCEAADSSIPVVGDLNDIDYELLTRLKPTHVLIQPPQAGVPSALKAMAAERDWTITAAHIDSVAEIRDAVHAIADAVDVRGQSRELAEELSLLLLDDSLNDLAAAGEPGPDAATPLRVLLLYMTDPPSVFGAGTYLDDVLRRLGALNASDARGWAQLTLEDITRLDPPAILFIQPGAPEDVDVRVLLGPISELNIAAVRDGRLAVIRHQDALLPSTSVIDVAAEMRSALGAWSASAPAD